MDLELSLHKNSVSDSLVEWSYQIVWLLHMGSTAYHALLRRVKRDPVVSQ